MSIKLMSAIFETEFRELVDEKGNVTKASTAKFVTIALADHANDEGEGAYPSLDRLARKTSLSRTCIIDTLDALKYNGIVILEGESKLGTNNYTVNKHAFPGATGDELPRLLVNPVDPPSQPGLPPVVNPVDPNHPLTILKPSSGAVAPADLPLDWQIASGAKTVTLPDEKKARMKDAANLIAVDCGMYASIAYEISLAFMETRDILIPEGKIKGQRKAAKEMAEMGVYPSHVRAAVKQLLKKEMTVVDLFSISKTAIDLANKPKEKSEPEHKRTMPTFVDGRVVT